MHTTIESLRALGISVDDAGTGSLPFTVNGTGSVPGGEVTIDASASSQFVSGLLLAAARYENGITLRHEGEHLPSMPHIEMTLDCLAKRGVKVSTPSPAVWRVEPGPISGGTVAIEPDLSNAGPFLAAAMVAGGSVTVPHWPTSTTQVGDEFDGILQKMGAIVTRNEHGLTVTGNGKIHGIDIDLSIGGELTPVIAALAAIADSPTRITGVAHLRGHETDRLAALATEINRIGTNLNRPDVATLAFRDTQDQKGSGYEFEVTANPVRNLRLTANLALPETSAVNLQPGLTAYFNANVAAWTAAGPTSLNPTQVNNDINTIRNALAALAAGATHVQGTVNGYGERTGNCNLTSVIPLVHFKMKKLGVPAASLTKTKEKREGMLTRGSVARPGAGSCVKV